MIPGAKQARRPTPESRQFAQDEKNRQRHITAAQRAFQDLLTQIQPFANKAKEEFPGEDRESLQRQGRLFNKITKSAPAMVSYLDTWIGTEDQHPQAYSWRGAILYQARDVLLYGKPLNDALAEVGKQAFKGFEAITMAIAQAPLRQTVPPPLRDFLPKNIVVEVDEKGVIQRVTDRFENEHFTLGKKIEKMRTLVRDYNKIAAKVKRDFKHPDELIRMAAIITAVMMETGIRPGKAGNGKLVTNNGEEMFVETFGAITLGPSHVRFVRNNFAHLEFVGKMTSVNTAEISDAAIIKVLKDYVDRALSSGSKYIFVTKKGEEFGYADLQRYFRENFGDLSPTDFRKLKATETVLAALRSEQAALYTRIKAFAKESKHDLQDRIVEAIMETFEAAVAKSQASLSHDDASTTVKSYINPEIILRFLSTGRVDESLEAAILSGKTTLAFDPRVFAQAAGVRLAFSGHRASLGDLLVELRKGLQGLGMGKMARAVVRVANRWMSAGTEADIQNNIQKFVKCYEDLQRVIDGGRARLIPGDQRYFRLEAKWHWVPFIRLGFTIVDGILSTRTIPQSKAKGLELAYRFFSTSRQVPRNLYTWWEKNQRHADLLIEAAVKWPAKQEGTNDLFKIGSFRVHNTVGVTGAELESLKKTIAAAEKMARKNPVPGFTRTVYGDIHVVANISKAHHAAWYYPGEDSLYLRWGTKFGLDEAQSIVHELGHRYWHKFAEKTKKQAWLRHHFKVEGSEIPMEDVQIPQVGEPVPELKIKGVKGAPVVSRMDAMSLYFDVTIRGRQETFSIFRRKVIMLRQENLKRSRNFPTRYSAKNEQEHFCEALKLRAAGVLPTEHLVPFKAIWE